MKRKAAILLIFSLIISLTACAKPTNPAEQQTPTEGGQLLTDMPEPTGAVKSDVPGQNAQSQGNSSQENAGENNTSGDVNATTVATLKDSDFYTDYSEKDYTTIAMSGKTASVTGKKEYSVNVSEGNIHITEKGTYVLTGDFEGTVTVNVTKDDKVRLVLNNVSITAANGPAISGTSCDKLIIMLPEGTVNTLTDAKKYTDTSDGAPNACLYCKDDLTINGEGTLNVIGNYMHGISTKDDLKLVGGKISVTSAKDAVRGHDSLYIYKPELTISAGDDAVHSDKYVVIDSGKIDIKKCYEGLEAAIITINGGSISIVASDDGINAFGGNDMFGPGGGWGRRATPTPTPEVAEPALDPYIYINGGNIYVNSKGDGLDSNGNIEMNGGTVVISGPTDNGNNATDYDGTFIMNGGTIVACGTTGMYQSISAGSKCYAIDYTSNSYINAGTEASLYDGETKLFSFTVDKRANAILIAGECLEKDKEYKLVLGSTSVNITAGEGSSRGGFGPGGGGFGPGGGGFNPGGQGGPGGGGWPGGGRR